MAKNSIEKMLELNTMIESGQKSSKSDNNSYRVTNKQDLDSLIENIDNQVYGQVVTEDPRKEKRKEYNAKEELALLEKLESGDYQPELNLEGRGMPKEIIESIINNPLYLKPIPDKRMEELTERIKNSKIQSSVDLIDKIEKKSKSATVENLNENILHTTAVDNSNIKEIIEECINNKFEELKNSLNESKNKQAYIPSMKYLSFKDNFYFVDNDDNVFECVMKYKGKRKK